MTINLMCSVVLGLGLASIAIPADAQDVWPTRPVHVYVGFPAGSSPDTLARIINEPLAERLGQPVIVENCPGASGMIGIREMLAAANDGQAFGVTTNGPLTTGPRLAADTSFDVGTDIVPVTLIATSPHRHIAAGPRGIGGLGDHRRCRFPRSGGRRAKGAGLRLGRTGVRRAADGRALRRGGRCYDAARPLHELCRGHDLDHGPQDRRRLHGTVGGPAFR